MTPTLEFRWLQYSASEQNSIDRPSHCTNGRGICWVLQQLHCEWFKNGDVIHHWVDVPVVREA